MTIAKTTRTIARGANRRGIAGVWLVVSIPLFVAVLGFVLNVGFLWIAEADLDHAAASGALAGAKVLGNRAGQSTPDVLGNDNDNAVAAAAEFIQSNRVQRGSGGKTEQSRKPGGRFRRTILLGTVEDRTFRTVPPGKPRHACFVQLARQVEGPLGWLTGPKTVHASAVAVIGRDGRPRLVEIDRVQGDD
jgi:hypothetical protein